MDIVTVSGALGSRIEMAGGLNYLSRLAMSVVTTENIAQHIDIIKKTSNMRKLIEAADQISRMCYEAKEDAEVILDRAEQKVFEIAESRANMGFAHIRDVLVNSIDNVEKLREAGGRIAGRADRIFGS